MKKLVLVLIIILGFFSCEPNPASENITFDPLVFKFSDNNTSNSIYSIGDTLVFESRLQNNHLSNGVCHLGLYISHSDSLPQTQASQSHEVYNLIDYNLFNIDGLVKHNSSVEGLVLGLENTPINDSIKIKFKFIPLKKGLYVLGLSPSFYQGINSKARTSAYFDVENHHWNYYQVPNQNLPIPGTEEYKKYYFIAVTD